MKHPVYRPCVGVMLVNREGLVFIGRRKNKRLVEHVAPGHEWQMPQGGIDDGEDPYEACLRELYEETNVRSVSLIAEAPDWYHYDLPKDVAKKSWKGRFAGQRQKWFALRFLGTDGDIDINKHEPEFSAWKWAPLDGLPALIVPFKRDVYKAVIEELGPAVRAAVAHR